MTPRSLLPALLLCFSASLAGCASQAPGPQAPPAPAPPPPETHTPTTVISSGGTDGTSAELFERGKLLMAQEKFTDAVAVFDLVLKGDPEPKLAAMALIQGALAAEGAGDREGALARYQRLIEQHPKDDLVKTAMLRRGRMLIHLEKWTELAAASEALQARPDLTIAEQVEVMGDRALGLIESGNVDQSSTYAERARTLMEKHHIGEAGRIPHEAALVYFAQGEVRRARSEKIRFEPPPPNFSAAFEERAAGLLESQSAYTDAMRTTDPFWATWAGYRVGQLYQQLHHDVMVVKPPEKAQSDKDRKLYEGALQLRYRILLQKGLKMMQSTVRMNERVGETNLWGQRARDALAQLEKEIAAANAIIQRTGIPEETLKAALEQMNKELAKKKLSPPHRQRRRRLRVDRGGFAPRAGEAGRARLRLVLEGLAPHRLRQQRVPLDHVALTPWIQG